MFSLIFDKTAVEFLSKLEGDACDRILEKLEACKENPFRFVEHLEQIDGFKLRVGDYRIILDIDRSEKKITIIEIGHRKNVYK